MPCVAASHARAGAERRQHRSTMTESANFLISIRISPAMSSTSSSMLRSACQRVVWAGIKSEESPAKPTGGVSGSSTSAAMQVVRSVNSVIRPQAPPPMMATRNSVSNSSSPTYFTCIVIDLHQSYAAARILMIGENPCASKELRLMSPPRN